MNEREIFVAALKKSDPAERAAYLAEACSDDAALRERVESLLREQDQLGSFLESRALAPGATVDRPPATEKPGTVIGPYKLLQQIGEGGMGVVWMAEQTQPVQRKVALKVIKPGMDSRLVIARFEAERQALAMMDHVNIARVLDAGTTESGLPYFVMELVHGVPITQYCDDNHLTPHERLELFVPVCQAIQHAHQKGIIHRDIKPSNVMITLYDGKPVPKVIDFGVAKATEQTLTERTLFTQYGTMVGTLEYMSPEQAEMSALGVDTRSDIFSLGVLLYELLTGSTPLTHKRLKEAAYAEVLRMIKEEEPPKPSTRLTESGEAMASISAQRHMEPAKLTKLVRGELDWIVMKTLEKDRNRRYETASALVHDIENYLHDDPVLACPPSAWYRFRKFARRNKATFATTSAVALVMVLAVVGLAVSNLLITQERNEKAAALNQAKLNEEAADRLRQLAQANLNTARDAVDQMLSEVGEQVLEPMPHMELVRRSLLEKALHFYQGFTRENSRDPAVRLGTGEAYRRIGKVYSYLGQLQQAEEAYREATSLLERLVSEFPGEPSYRAALASAHHGSGDVFERRDRPDEAEKAYRQAIALWQELPEELRGETQHFRAHLNCQRSLALLLTRASRHQEAEKMMREILPMLEELSGRVPSGALQFDLAGIYGDLGTVLRTTGRKQDAEQPARQAVHILEGLVAAAPDHPSMRWHLAFHQLGLGRVLRDLGKSEAAEKLYRESIRLTTKLASDFPSMPDYRSLLAETNSELCRLLAAQGRFAEAEQAHAHTMEVCELLIADAPNRPWFQMLLVDHYSEYGRLLLAAGRTEQVEQLYQSGVTFYTRILKSNPGTAWTYRARGDLHGELGEWDQALADHWKAIDLGAKDTLKDWYPCAVLCLWTGRRDQYRVLCQRLLQEFGQTTNRYDAHWVVVICKLDSTPLPDLTRPLELGEKVSYNRGPYANLLYRKGDYATAVKELDEAIRLEGGTSASGVSIHFNQLFRAMAHYRLGNFDRARKDLEQATARIDNGVPLNPPPAARGWAPLSWPFRLDLQMLRREAEELLKQNSAASNQPSEKKPQTDP